MTENSRLRTFLEKAKDDLRNAMAGIEVPS